VHGDIDFLTDIDWELVVRCWGEDASAEERARLVVWLSADPEHGRLLDAAFMAADIAVDTLPEAADVGMTGEQRAWRIHSRRPLRPAWVGGVAGAAVVAGAIGLRRLGAYRSESRPGTVAAARVVVTRPGETADVRLPDGTRVLLGAASVLRYTAESSRARDVALTGEGYFEVVHDTARPFRVHVGATTAEDIGTAFDVRAYGSDPGVRIIVSNGAVSIRANFTRSPVVLRRGSLGLVDAAGEVQVTAGVAVERYLAWTRGELVFTDEPLGTAVADIGRRFDLTIHLGDPALAARRLTASFADDPIADVVRALESAMGLRAVREGQTITLYPR
jgi:transmembrane sensor